MCIEDKAEIAHLRGIKEQLAQANDYLSRGYRPHGKVLKHGDHWCCFFVSIDSHSGVRIIPHEAPTWKTAWEWMTRMMEVLT